MKVIGITGGIGSGKSDVLEYLHDKYGATIVKADEVAKKLQKKGKECYGPIVDYFGDGILDEKGEIDRKALANIVFNDQEKLDALNQITHPLVKEEINRLIEKERKKNTNYFFIEAALLLEAHYEEICDEIWYIYVSDENRMKRLKFNRGYDTEKVTSIMKNQAPKEQFFKLCDRVIDNNRTFLEACYQIDAIMKNFN
ncbi:dephospho-CoA kinase [Lachnospiraceae bacterium PF1-21]|uniref:Dephospho-CoA kinase n=1 Tax=Ohessyouella blattaphilus TaxID=2949333 RepID=A0ABT1EEN7_9FIRM|nr:dephospho-CoA kinase [Ohessyouella blattaphilus]MCP1109160.1 dephospho-CoA kinase [Ohessyouella blattaphilus]MCR8562554.1 dephospho-CoA kinase [Ohessyouella blattaphilus]MDL2250262.1 dephospho-CoA kinase [Lachnospiraceae bacterium OttesenSCG-928-J05]